MVIPRRVLLILLIGALVLPVALAVLFLVGLLLAAMADDAGQAFTHRLSVVCLVLWLIDLVLLLFALTLAALGRPDLPPE